MFEHRKRLHNGNRTQNVNTVLWLCVREGTGPLCRCYVMCFVCPSPYLSTSSAYIYCVSKIYTSEHCSVVIYGPVNLNMALASTPYVGNFKVACRKGVLLLSISSFVIHTELIIYNNNTCIPICNRLLTESKMN